MKSWKRAGNQRGVLIIWLALFLLSMIGFASIGIDLAKLAATQAQLQVAADAAALAGAMQVDSSAMTPTIIYDQAVAAAQATAAQNKAYEDARTPVLLDAADVVLLNNNSRLQVTTRREAGLGTGMMTHFAAVFLGPVAKLLDMKATAVAEVSYPNQVDCGVVPLGVVQPPSGGFLVGCAYEYSLKLDPEQSTEGNFGFIDFPPCDNGACAGMSPTGKATVRCLIANGYCCALEIGQVIDTEPGNASGPFLQGMDGRWDADTDQRDGICYSEYTGNGMRLILVPITTPFPSGRGQVTILGFAQFFLRYKPTGVGLNSEMKGEFVTTANAPGSGHGGPPGTVVTVRLVK